MHVLNLFIQLVQEHRYLGYTVLFFAMIYEGELFLATAGMLVGMRAFDPFDAFFFAFGGVLTGDLLWFWLGHYLKTHHANRTFISDILSKVHKVLPGLERNPAHVIFLSKFIYGLNHSTILALGYLKINFKEFCKVQFFTSLLWVVIFFVLGYLFGSAAIAFTHSFSKLLLVILLIVLGIFFLEKRVRKYLIRREKEI